MRHRFRSLLSLILLAACALPALRADQNYSQQVFFDTSLSPGSYYYSSGRASSPSTLQLVDKRLPVETSTFVSGPNALRLEWQSKPTGGWEANLSLYEWRDRYIDFPGKNLYLWVYAPEAIAPRALPRIALRDEHRNFTPTLPLARFVTALPAKKWTRIRIPLAVFPTASLHPFEPRRLTTIYFTQGADDDTPHTLFLDDIRIEDAPTSVAPPPAVSGVAAKGYDRHIDITWKPVSSPTLAQYVIYRSTDDGPFQPIGVQRAGVNRYADFLGDDHATASYKVSARTSSLKESKLSAAVTASTHRLSDDELLTMVQEASFRYYWEAAEPNSGLTRENTPGDDDILAMGASGFGVMATIVGVEHNFITRQQAVDRLNRATRFLERADRFHGVWPHFLSGSTGKVRPVFGIYDNGGDLVETSFLMEGLLTARQYFREDTPAEHELRTRITRLWEGIEWDWYRIHPKQDALWWHWSPEYSYYIQNRLTGWNEVMITYLLAIASPTHGVDPSLYYTGWVGEGTRESEYAPKKSFYGIKLTVGDATGGPLFFTDYSYMGFDPRHRRDKYTDYSENNTAIARINRAYCEANPNHWKGYGKDTWGLTAVDGPDGYTPFEPTQSLDDGTLAPTGAVSAYVYTPDASLAAIKHFYRDLGAHVWDIYGFRDAFNLERNWYSGITMGLNQAPMAVMIENRRSGLLWKNFMANPEIEPMLSRIGFKSSDK